MKTSPNRKISRRVSELLKECQAISRALDETLIDVLAGFVPWLAPAASAYLAGRNMAEVLKFHPAMAALVALVVEFLGIAAFHTFLLLWDYNSAKRKIDEPAPWPWAAGAAGGYMLVVLVVNVLLDDSPVLHRVAKALLSSLSIVGAVTLALRSQHARRLALIAEDKVERKRAALKSHKTAQARKAREARKAAEIAGKSPESRRTVNDWRELSPEDRRQVAGMTAKEIVDLYPVSDRTAREWREKAKKNGHTEEA